MAAQPWSGQGLGHVKPRVGVDALGCPPAPGSPAAAAPYTCSQRSRRSSSEARLGLQRAKGERLAWACLPGCRARTLTVGALLRGAGPS